MEVSSIRTPIHRDNLAGDRGSRDIEFVMTERQKPWVLAAALIAMIGKGSITGICQGLRD